MALAGHLPRFGEQTGIANRVVFTDFIEPAAIANYYAAGDAFVFASRTETQGLSTAEALCAGLPCVVVNAMGVSETVEPDGDTPRGAAPGSALPRGRQAIGRKPDLRQRMGARARERAPLFSKDHRITQLVEHYEEVVEENTLRNEAARFELV